MSRLRDYAEILAGSGVDRGLLGPRESERLWDRHILNCAVVHELLPHGATVYDVGSGAGLPGVVLAIVRPDLSVTLVEPLLRRAGFLEECVAELDLDNVAILRSRAEELADSKADVVTARAVAPLGQLVEWCLPLVRPGGELLAIRGRTAESEVKASEPVMRSLGAARWSVVRVGAGITDPPAIVVRVRMRDRTSRSTRPRPVARPGRGGGRVRRRRR